MKPKARDDQCRPRHRLPRLPSFPQEQHSSRHCRLGQPGQEQERHEQLLAAGRRRPAVVIVAAGTLGAIRDVCTPLPSAERWGGWFVQRMPDGLCHDSGTGVSTSRWFGMGPSAVLTVLSKFSRLPHQHLPCLASPRLGGRSFAPREKGCCYLRGSQLRLLGSPPSMPIHAQLGADLTRPFDHRSLTFGTWIISPAMPG